MSEANIKEKAKQQREVNDFVKRILADFVGREMTPLLVAEAEGRVRETIVSMILSGTYVLPVGLAFDYVKLSADMKIQVYFKRLPTKVVS